MVTGALSTLFRLRVTVSYAVMLVAVATTLLMRGPGVRELVISRMSTNLHNLEHGRLGTLIGSAFVTENGPIWVWLPGLVCLLAAAELLWRSGRVLVTFALGHIGATLIVAAGLAAAIKFGWLPMSVARATDVGNQLRCRGGAGRADQRRFHRGGGPHGSAGGYRWVCWRCARVSWGTSPTR